MVCSRQLGPLRLLQAFPRSPGVRWRNVRKTGSEDMCFKRSEAPFPVWPHVKPGLFVIGSRLAFNSWPDFRWSLCLRAVIALMLTKASSYQRRAAVFSLC